jgi:hypothetical protein
MVWGNEAEVYYVYHGSGNLCNSLRGWSLRGWSLGVGEWAGEEEHEEEHDHEEEGGMEEHDVAML